MKGVCKALNLIKTIFEALTRETGTYIGLYALLLAGSNYLAPVFAGFINDGQGWKWVLVGHSQHVRN